MLAIIGGTGLSEIEDLEIIDEVFPETKYGRPSAPISVGQFAGKKICFLARHGQPHVIPPHKINYRANIESLKSLGVDSIVAVAAVGGIRQDLGPAELCIPDQIIDYTYGRSATFYEDGLEEVVHVDFSYPYSESLRQHLGKAVKSVGLNATSRAVYGATQGPRLETGAEIKRLRQDGCDLVGMTGMPEAVLAREAGLEYACLAVVANWAAGVIETEITMDEILVNLKSGMERARRVMTAAIPHI